MKTTHTVAKLASSQVSELLALGLNDCGTPSPVELLQQGLSEADRSKRNGLLADLKSPIPFEPGPVSFTRLTGLTDQDAEQLSGETFLSVLASPQTSLATFNALIRFGELLSRDGFPESTQLAGSVIRVLALSLRAKRHGVPIDSRDAPAVSTSIDALVETQTLSKEIFSE